MNNTSTFAIAGGGIGGLTLAIAMQRKGFNVHVYESAPELKPIGAALGLGANAVKALFEIGIGDEVLTAGKIIKYIRIKDQRGKILSETDSEQMSLKLGAVNNFTIHRADLHRILLDKLVPGTLILNKSIATVDQKNDGVVLRFHDGSSEFANYLIACDGIHSVVRKQFLPESTLRYAGYTCWRAVIDEIPPGINMEETSETWGAGCRFGIVPLTGNRLYWFACVNAKQNDMLMKSFRIPELLSYFSDFHFPVQEILRATKNDQLIWSDIADIKPLQKFAFGNIVLMGDAAHATTPNMGQGACMAIEDAAILANCIEDYTTPEEAFKYFEQKRIKRTTRIVNESWLLGKAAQLENPLLVMLRNTAIRMTPDSVSERQMKFIHDISF
jgi:2-polyprenyl-6-methoxyphenol hydroxylase-like FAD-dependent oxidoreductase